MLVYVTVFFGSILLLVYSQVYGTFFYLSMVTLGAGLYLLIKGADILVEGAVAVAERFGVSKLFIGLSLVAFGTSAPELAVSLSSAVKGVGGIAISNVVGSNIANIVLCLGLTFILIKNIKTPETTIKIEIPFLLIVTVSFGAMLLRDTPSTVVWNDGVVLLGFLIIYIYYLFRMATSDMEILEKAEHINLKNATFMIIFGLAGVVLGGDFTVDSVVKIAKLLGLSNSLFGLTVVAVGTSLPELVTSLTAAGKGHSDMSLGNIVGSNIMNILVIIGLTSVAGRKLVVDVGMYYVDVIYLIGTVILLSIFSLKKAFGKLEGGILLGVYTSYLWFVLWRG